MGKYFDKKCFLSFLIPLLEGHSCSNNVRETFFVRSFGSALFYLRRIIMNNSKEKVIIMGEEWDKENLEWFKKALVEGISRRLERELNSDKETNQ